MKNAACKLTFVLCTVLIPSLGHAEKILKLGEGVNLFAINGKEISKESGFFSVKDELPLPDDAINQILVSYTADIKRGNSYDLEQSDLFVIKFSAPEQQLTINAPEISSTYQLDAFNKEMNWSLKASDDTPITYDVAPLPIKGFRLGVDYERELKKFNQTSATAATLSTDERELPFSTRVTNAPEAQQAFILENLQHWYKLATPDTREKFKATLEH
jgi:hypothetical protein